MKPINKTFGDERGAVLVAVIVAMLFIGIVTASMLRNTAAQAGAAMSYGAVMEMSSTLGSGIVATEAYIGNAARARDAADALQLYADGHSPTVNLFIKTGAPRIKLTERQFFSSEITALDKGEFAAAFDIGAARSLGGRNMRRATAFYQLGNLKVVSNAYGAKNAVYMKGDLRDGNNGMEIKNGSATFEGRVRFQNRPAIFHGEAYFNDDVNILHPPEFRANAYFNQNLTAQNIQHDKAGIFKKDAGIRGTLSTEGGPSLRADGEIYYGDGLLSKLKMDTLTARRDPQIDISQIPSDKIKSGVSVMGSNVSVQKINAAYEKAKADGDLYNDHLVLKIRPGDPINFNEPHDAIFDKKLILIVENGASLNVGGRFFHSSDKSSTLIYAAEGNATINEFGSSGLFRGLIYVDSLNTSNSNSFNWKNGGRIEGAFHNFSNRNFIWNTGSANPVEVKFDEEAINGFGFLVKGAGGEAGAAIEFADGEERIDVKRAGIYFY